MVSARSTLCLNGHASRGGSCRSTRHPYAALGLQRLRSQPDAERAGAFSRLNKPAHLVAGLSTGSLEDLNRTVVYH